MTTDRKQLIRLAAKRPIGDPLRRTLLAELCKQSSPKEAGIDLKGVARAWIPDFKKILTRVPSEIRREAGLADVQDSYAELVRMLETGKGQRGQSFPKDVHMVSKLESLESDMWFEGILDRWDLDELGLDEDELRMSLQAELSEALMKAGLVGKKAL